MERVTPADVMNIIRKRFGISMHITNVRKHLRRMCKSYKRATKWHANRAERMYVQRRQRRVRGWISRMKRLGFEAHVQDEAIFKEGRAAGPSSGRTWASAWTSSTAAARGGQSCSGPFRTTAAAFSGRMKSSQERCSSGSSGR